MDKYRRSEDVESCTYIVQNDTHKYVQRNSEEIHDGTPGLLWDVLGPHLHDGWPEDTHTTFKETESEKVQTAASGDTLRWCVRQEELHHHV